ncbi:MAG: glycosyltransferase [Muribaculaceae bacterium]
MKVAVIILNYNSSRDCKRCVEDLLRQGGIDLEIIIVDNCSNEVDRLAVKKLCSDNFLTFIPAAENRGYNAGNNIGLRYACSKNYKYALIANPDMQFPETDYVAKLVAKMEEDPEIAVCGSNIVGMDGRPQSPSIPDSRSWLSAWKWVLFPFMRKKELPEYIDNCLESHYCQKISGCCLLVRLLFMREIDFFDENVFLYCEEAILSKQVEKCGKRIYFLQVATAIHAHIKSEKGDPRVRFRNWLRSRLYFEKVYNYDGAVSHFLKEFGLKTYMLFFT